MSSSSEREAIEAALSAAGIGGRGITLHELSGGCIHRVWSVTTDDGRRFVAKVNRAELRSLFDEEAAGIRALAATNTVRVPETLATVTHAAHAVILMTFIDPPADCGDRNGIWRSFGDDLAAFHLAPLQPQHQRGYGFECDNHLGVTPQRNSWCGDWVQFNAENRLGPQARMAHDRGLLTSDECCALEGIVNRLDRILPAMPRASLLHGDLWSGNVLPCVRANERGPVSPTCALIDPAPSVGDALADIAMMRLFGGFGHVCFDAWSERMNIDLACADSRERIAAYQLYHVLNHVNMFGRGYVGQAMILARGILSAKRV
jgi:fructosamine-3-kinase